MTKKSKSPVTKDEYYRLKKLIKTPKDCKNKKFGRCESTLRKIKNTKDYEEYLAVTFRYHGHPHKKPAPQEKPKEQQATNKNAEIAVIGFIEETEAAKKLDRWQTAINIITTSTLIVLFIVAVLIVTEVILTIINL